MPKPPKGPPRPPHLRALPLPAPDKPAGSDPARRRHRRAPLEPAEQLFDRAKVRRGRPCKLDAQIVADVETLLAQGNYVSTVAAALGIARDTFYAWIAEGEATPPRSKLHREFSDAVKQAQGEAEAVGLLQMREGRHQDWRRHARFLERRYPERWGQRVAITGAEGAPPAGVTIYQPGVRLPRESDD